MRVVVIKDTADTLDTLREVMAGIKALSPEVRVYIGSKKLFDYELAIGLGADGWIDLPVNNSRRRR